jgi:hypothetical protein
MGAFPASILSLLYFIPYIDGFFLDSLSNYRSKLSREDTCLSAVRKIESTPNPLSFKLDLDQVILSGPGQTFYSPSQEGCPESVKAILLLKGIENVYAMPDWVCVNKLPSNSYPWDEVLPLCVSTLGGVLANSEASEALNRLTDSRQRSQG